MLSPCVLAPTTNAARSAGAGPTKYETVLNLKR